jgi:hypothetical protein
MIVRQIVAVLLLIRLLQQVQILQQHFALVLDQGRVLQVQVAAEVNQEANLVLLAAVHQEVAVFAHAMERAVDGHHLTDLHGH